MKHLSVRVVSTFAILLFVWSESPAQWVQTNCSFPGNGTISALAFSGTNLFLSILFDSRHKILQRESP